MHTIRFDFTIDTVLMIVIFNVLGTALQYVLTYIHDKKRWEWSEAPLKAINFLMTMVAFVIANKAHPVTGSETGPDNSKK